MKFKNDLILSLFKRLSFIMVAVCSVAMASCSKDDPATNGGGNSSDDKDEDKPATITYWRLDTTKTNMKVSIASGAYVLTSLNGDPQIQTEALKAVNNADSVVLTFEYKASQDLLLEGFFNPVSAKTKVTIGNLEETVEWRTFSCNLKDEIAAFKWGDRGDFMRLDFGGVNGAEVSVRKIYLRKMTEAEQSAYDKVVAEKEQINALSKSLDSYIKASYASQVSNVSFNTSTNKVTISGNVPASGDYSLSEITPYQDVTVEDDFAYSYDITNGAFSVELDRYVTRGGFSYDRLLSKWVVVKSEGGKKSIDSHARYTDEITPAATGTVMKLKGKKGMGGVASNYLKQYPNDMKELGVHSVTYNIVLQTLMRVKSGAGFTEPYTYGGKTYYINTAKVNELNTALKTLNDQEISVAAILLVGISGADEIFNLMLHPRYEEGGTYTMPNMTTAASVNCYAALLNYLASKFSSSTSDGKIDHWIMHNEVSAGSSWTNMGSPVSTPMSYYLDTYEKSMRMAYNIIRQYNSESEIFGSFTHHWVTAADYSCKEMLERMVEYSNVEGDYKWAVAYHCYPQSLFEPKTWNDTEATFSFDTKYITFKNLEVLSAWIKQSSQLYKGETKRSVWLSENGTNSRTYSDEHLYEHAAGCAYSLKKLNELDGIDAVQWHRWIDHPLEGGLLIGVRKLDDDTYNCEKKPAYDVFCAVGTDKESEVIDKYLPFIGVESWDDIFEEVK